MCILFAHSGGLLAGGYKLIFASNRDEFFKRPAESAAAWKEDATVIGGRDMEKGREGGTWLAASPSRRRLAALLNLPGVPVPENALGRGPIVSNFVLGNETTEEYVSNFKDQGREYGPFNLVTVHILDDSSNINFYSNFDCELRSYDGAVAFSNSAPNKPLQKTTAGLERFNEIVTQNAATKATKEQLVDELLSLLKWDKLHLPDLELEKRKPNAHDGLSAVFVNIPGAKYGTRTHTIILVDGDDNLDFWEWTMIPGEAEWKLTHLKHKLQVNS
ncbi:transport and golgi organization 2 [Arctopsyche grandis]|uniref:transport and golgi organization 2 n=1 Tax=Arctopsyche grandis TaxID=121162 RepID=UPI00406D8A59